MKMYSLRTSSGQTIRREVSFAKIGLEDLSVVNFSRQMIMEKRWGLVISNVLVVFRMDDIRWRAEGEAGTNVVYYVVYGGHNTWLERLTDEPR